MNVTVVEVKGDFDPWGGEYAMVSFGYKLPLSVASAPVTMIGPQPKQIAYKHALHLIIPKDKWQGQYTMWDNYHLVVKDDGLVELKKAQ